MATDPRDLCTVQNVKDAFEPTVAGTSRDARIQTLITSASLAIMKELERELTPHTADATRRFRVDVDDADGGTIVDLNPYDLRTVTSVTLHPEATSPTPLSQYTGYTLEPVGAPQGSYLKLRLSTQLILVSDFMVRFGYALIDVRGAWGLWDTAQVDPDVVDACVLTVRAWMRQNPAAYQMPGSEPAAPVQASVPQTFEIPGAAMKKLNKYRRWAI
jgi:hypothetical protein